AAAPQRVRFTPTALDIDDTSKLWGMLYQNNTPYALSLIYQGIAVLIDGRSTPVEPKPVKTRTVHAVPDAG
ncbi:Pvc16 family protein, partial [Streptomyces broussonetiae]